MSFFSNPSQQLLDQSAASVFQSINTLLDLLERSAGTQSYHAKTELEKLDSLIGQFHQLCNTHNTSVKTIKWAGTSVSLYMVVANVNAFMREMTEMTGYKFICKTKINS